MVDTTTASTANTGCPCIDSSQILLSQSNCIRLEDGSPGVWVPFSTVTGGSEKNNQTKAAGACFPVSYGANECAAHDMKADPRCMTGDNQPPGYCKQQFCFVVPEVCKASTESFFLSSHFDDLYFSYSTCNSTEDEWIAFDSTYKLDGLKLKVAVPGVVFPNHYKLSPTTGEVADFRGDEYYDDDIPWMGWQLEYFNHVARISNLGEVTYTYQSRSSDIKSPQSSWTATVHDVQAGISCLAVSNFWITAERLKLTAFTAPMATEKLHMFIQSPGAATSSGSTVAENVQKTLAPFEPNLWYLTLGLVIFVAVLSVVFANQQGELSLYWEKMRSPKWKRASYLGRARIFSRMAFESFLLTFTDAVTQSVGTNTHNSLAQKFTNVGFAFYLLILVSAYTANLAAFLTVSLAEQEGYVKDIHDAIARGLTICGQGALKDDLSQHYPNANFLYFDVLDAELEAYDAGDCAVVLASPHIHLFVSTTRMKEFCKRDLVMTGPPVLEIPIGFPVCSDFAGGISHWIYEAQKRGITYMSYLEQNLPEPVCSFDLPEETGDSDMARLSVEHFALPFIIFMVCIGLAILRHVYDWKTREDKEKALHNQFANQRVTTGQSEKEWASEVLGLTKKNKEVNATVDASERSQCMTEIETMMQEIVMRENNRMHETMMRENNRMLEKIAAVVAEHKGVQRDTAGSYEDPRSTRNRMDWIVQHTNI